MVFTFFDWKHLNEPIIYYSFSFLNEKRFWNLSSLLHNLTNVLNLFLFMSIFSVFLNDYFFRWLAVKSLLSRFSLLVNYIMWSCNIFSVSSCSQCFSWSWFFRVQVQDLGLGFRGSPTLGGCLCDDCTPSYLPLIIFDRCTFSRRVKAWWWRQSAKNQVSVNQNSRNRWYLIVRRAIC